MWKSFGALKTISEFKKCLDNFDSKRGDCHLPPGFLHGKGEPKEKDSGGESKFHQWPCWRAQHREDVINGVIFETWFGRSYCWCCFTRYLRTGWIYHWGLIKKKTKKTVPTLMPGCLKAQMTVSIFGFWKWWCSSIEIWGHSCSSLCKDGTVSALTFHPKRTQRFCCRLERKKVLGKPSLCWWIKEKVCFYSFIHSLAGHFIT